MPPDTDIEEPVRPPPQEAEPEQPPRKPKRKHTVETAEAVPFILLAILFDIISLATFMAPLIAVMGKFIFTCIWLMHGVMPWSKKYWSWYLISFVCEFIPFVSILPMFTIGELKMIAQSRVEDKLQETTGLAQAAVQVAKFKVRQRVKRNIAAGGMSEEELKKKKELSKSLRFASARTVRRSMVNKAQGRGPKYRDYEGEGGDGSEGVGETGAANIRGDVALSSRPSRGATSGSEAFDGVVAGASMAASAGRSASLPPTRPLPPKTVTDDETADETNEAVAANASGAGLAPAATQLESTETVEVTGGPEIASAEPSDSDFPNDSIAASPASTLTQSGADDEIDTALPANDTDTTGLRDDAAIAQNNTEPETTFVTPQNIASAPTGVQQAPANDIYREPIPTNENAGLDDTDATITDEDTNQPPQQRRAA